ncbi:hypothetical protein [Mesorhizobium sangaii]|uniref:Uncharacterized protein n=1 Tax=Mesorhizobium sangaii TaxID=505389 RepID=A0A841PK30_9HYPH|nr:hypothetical protein [Mesorhizobium sangaii]MBB6414391.1 hypothetical protein [Mesorhizobium sangaii]
MFAFESDVSPQAFEEAVQNEPDGFRSHGRSLAEFSHLTSKALVCDVFGRATAG